MRFHELFSKLSSFSFGVMTMWILLGVIDLARLHYGFTKGLPKAWIENPKLMVDNSIYGLIALFVIYITFIALEFATKPKTENN